MLSQEERRSLARGRARVVVVNVNNSTAVGFAAVAGQCRTLAGHFRAPPPPHIGAYSQVQLLTASEAFLGGNKASLGYEAQTRRREKLYLEWSFSFFGEKVRTFNAAPPLRVLAQQHAEGSLFELTFTISSDEPLASIAAPAPAPAAAVAAASTTAPVAPATTPPITVTLGTKPADDAQQQQQQQRVLTVATYTHAGEPCDDAFVRRFASHDVVCVQGVPTQEELEKLQERFRLTHSYIALMGRSHALGCGMLFASKLGIIKALPRKLASVVGLGGLLPAGGILACKLDVGPVFPGCSFWVFQMQHDDPSPRHEEEAEVAAEVHKKKSFSKDRLEAFKMRKLCALREYVAELLHKKESIPGHVGVVLTGDFGIADFAEVERTPVSTAASPEATDDKGKRPASSIDEDILPAIALDLNMNERIGFSHDIAVKLKSRGLPVELLGKLRASITSQRIRSLILTEMIARTIKHGFVKKLSREWDGNPCNSLVKYRSLVIDVLCVANSSWDARGPVASANTEFWQGDLKGRLEARFPGGLDERERGAAYDLRTHIVPFQLIRAMARALHARISSAAATRVVKYPGGHILPADIEELALPGLFVFPDAPRRKFCSQHLMALCELGARDIHCDALSSMPGGRVLKYSPTTTRILSLDRVPSRGSSQDSSAPQLAVISCIDGDSMRIADNKQPALSIMLSVSPISHDV